MYFAHASEIWRDFPDLVPGVLIADGVTGSAPVEARRVAGRLVDDPDLRHPEPLLPPVEL